MRTKLAVAGAVVFLSGWAAGLLLGCWWNPRASAPQGIEWQDNLEAAYRLAAETDRLVLVHFWSNSCAACRLMDCEVFAQPEVAAVLNTRFVPVRINAHQCPEVTQDFGVSSWPSDVVLTPHGEILERSSGGATAEGYVTRMIQIALAARRSSAPAVAQVAVAEPATGSAAGAPAAPATPGDAPPRQGTADGAQPEPEPRAVIAASASPPAESVAAASAPTPPAPAEKPPLPPPSRASVPAADPPTAGGTPSLALDGYCPVTLARSKRWVKGDPRWGVVHRGQTYLFNGPGEARQFYADPETYAPVASGLDLVAVVERDQAALGRREHGTWYGGRLYLFASETTRQLFERYPQRYVTAAAPAPAGPLAGTDVRRY